MDFMGRVYLGMHGGGVCMHARRNVNGSSMLAMGWDMREKKLDGRSTTL
jgi:hypothetical protein